MAEWVLILAAGESTRFDGIKALAPWKNGTLLSHAVQTAQLTHRHVMVVTGAYHEDMRPLLSNVSCIFNADWRDGMGRSLATGIKAILDHDHAASLITILPVDQPFVTADHLLALTSLAKKSNRCALTSSDETVGPPAAILSSFYGDLLKLDGDHGLKSVLKPQHYHIIDNPIALRDIDTQADWLKYSFTNVN